MTGIVVALLLPGAATALWLRRVDPDIDGPSALAWSVPLGLGAASVVWWGLLPIGPGSRSALAAADALVWAAAAVLLLWKPSRESTRPVPRAPGGPLRRVTAVLLVLTGGLAATAFVAAAVATPHGEWDAWAIWNLRARFLFHAYPDHWLDTFSPVLVWSHVEYPLLLPLTVARAWTYAGDDTAAVPLAIGAVFALAIVAVASLSVWRARSASRAALTAAAMLASPAFVRYSAAQCADIPLAFFVLAAAIWMSRGVEAPESRAPWYVAGAAAGLAAWTKNEGILFFAIATTLVVIRSAVARPRTCWRTVLRFAAGAAPAVVALVSLKALAPQNEIAASLSMSSLLGGIADGDRIWFVVTGMARAVWRGGGASIGVLPIVASFVLISGVRRPLPTGPLMSLTAALLLIAGYAAVYIVTPYDYRWHLHTSIDRVMLHAFPTFVWGAMMLARD